MLVGIPKEIKNHEYRVGLTPESVFEFVAHGHDVVVESKAGEGIGADDSQYLAAGASIVDTAEEVYGSTDLVIKVKEPQIDERKWIRPDQVLFTYLHLAPDPEQTRDLVASGAVCIAYETVAGRSGGLPLLKPMSQVAGRISVQAGATALERSNGGRGILLGGVPGVAPASVTIIGGGVAGFNAAQMAVGMGASVTVLDRNPEVLEHLGKYFQALAITRFSNRANLAESVAASDLVIGSVLIPGASSPKLVTREMLGSMKAGSVLVDIAIDQGGCFETSKPTTHESPTFVVDDVVHYCVANMPGAVARTSTYALNNVTLPHALNLADRGWKDALRSNPQLAAGLNVCQGMVTYQAVADDLGYDYVSVADVLG